MSRSKAQYIPRPAPAARKPNAKLDPDGIAVNSGRPHDDLIASLASTIPLQEQVDSLNRIGRIRRTTALRHLDLGPDDFGDYIDEEDTIGLTPYEQAGLREFSLDNLLHDVPPDNPEPIEPSAPKAGEDQ